MTISRSGLQREVPVAVDGAYSVVVAPGRYTVVGRSPHFNDGKAPCRAANDALVVAEARTTVDVLCHMD